jgi:thioredoxin-dependent peroxiredoxin
MINEGNRAPALRLAASDGSSVDLASPGSPLVLYFYPKDRNGSD